MSEGYEVPLSYRGDRLTNVIYQARECIRFPRICGHRESSVMFRNKRRKLLPGKKGIPFLYSLVLVESFALFAWLEVDVLRAEVMIPCVIDPGTSVYTMAEEIWTRV